MNTAHTLANMSQNVLTMTPLMNHVSFLRKHENRERYMILLIMAAKSWITYISLLTCNDKTCVTAVV